MHLWTRWTLKNLTSTCSTAEGLSSLKPSRLSAPPPPPLTHPSVSFQSRRWRVVAVRAGCSAAGRHHRSHPQPGLQQLRGGGAPDLVLPAQHAVPRRLPGRLPQVLQRAEGLWRLRPQRRRRRRRQPPPLQGQPALRLPQRGGSLSEVAGVGHAHLHSGLLPTAALTQPNWGAVGSPARRGSLAQQVRFPFSVYWLIGLLVYQIPISCHNSGN